MATRVLLRLAALTGEDRYRDAADRALRSVTSFLGRYPTGFGSWLSATSMAVEGIAEVAIVGAPDDPATAALVAAARDGERSDVVVAVSADPDASVIPLLAGRVRIEERPTAYVCRDFACRLPVTKPDAVRAELSLGGTR